MIKENVYKLNIWYFQHNCDSDRECIFNVAFSMYWGVFFFNQKLMLCRKSKHFLPTTQEKTLHTDITRWLTLKSDWLYSLIQSEKTRPGADCGLDHDLLIAKFRLKLKKVEKTIRPFRYDFNKIPYDYTVTVRNRFKGLDLIECLMNYRQRFGVLYRWRESRPSPRKRNTKRQNGYLRRPYK